MSTAGLCLGGGPRAGQEPECEWLSLLTGGPDGHLTLHPAKMGRLLKLQSQMHSSRPRTLVTLFTRHLMVYLWISTSEK